MVVTEFPMMTDLSLLQSKKDLSPMVVTERPMVTEVRPLQPKKT